MDQPSPDLRPVERAEKPLDRPVAPVRPVSTPDPRTRRRLRVRWLLALVILAAGAWLVWRLVAPQGGGHGRTPADAAAQPVGVARIGTGAMHVVLTGLGTVTPLATVTVQTQISGQLMSVGYTEGQVVQQGDFLVQIDPRPYQVALEQAQGTLAHDTALLNQARSDLSRYRTLNRQDSIAQQQFADQAFLVQQYEGSVTEDRASIDSAKLNLAYCHIVAPVTGRVGLRLVDPGNYVQAASATGLVVITQLQPISVVFVLPEDNIPAVAQAMRDGQSLGVAAYDRTDSTQVAAGTLLTIDNAVDTTTGTVKLRASFPNTDAALFPNQFVNARLLLQTLAGVVQAPTAAIQHGAPGTFVYLVKPGGTVGVQVIKTGVTDGDETQVTTGLKPGDLVVVDGADRLRDGAKVKVTQDAADPAATAQQPDRATDAPADGSGQGKHHHRHKPQTDQ